MTCTECALMPTNYFVVGLGLGLGVGQVPHHSIGAAARRRGGTAAARRLVTMNAVYL